MAEVDMFLTLAGVTGETADKSKSGAMDIINWTWGLSNSGNFHMATGGGVGKASIKDISVTKLIDKASPTLMQMCADGTHIPTGTLTCRKAGGSPLEYLVLTLQKVLVSSYSTQGSGSLQHEENFTLHFAQVKVEYSAQSPTGAKAAGGNMSWNVPANSKS
jgi:type VI secretion system secreted protein Hcp